MYHSDRGVGTMTGRRRVVTTDFVHQPPKSKCNACNDWTVSRCDTSDARGGRVGVVSRIPSILKQKP